MQNVVDLDYHSRVAAFEFQKEDPISKNSFTDLVVKHPGRVNAIPLLLLLDYAAASASVAHSWMFMILEAIRILKGWLNLIESLYDGNEAFGDIPSGRVLALLYH